jgi:hypothetical protein
MKEVAFSPFSGSLQTVSQLFDELSAEIRSAESGTAYDAVTNTALRRVAGPTQSASPLSRMAASARSPRPMTQRATRHLLPADSGR